MDAMATTTAPSPFPSQPPPPPPPSPHKSPSSIAPFRPSIAVIVGVLTTMFSLTFLLLLYAKHCKRTAASGNRPYGSGGSHGAAGSSATATAANRNSGVDRTVVESLPVFRFGSLRGHKEGLECAVCLGRFEPAELLRLLPKCKHAFHVECVDTWLDAHSTCPLCRCRVDPEDVLLVHHEPAPEKPGPELEEPAAAEKPGFRFFRAAGRISGRHSSAGEKSSDSPIQIVIHPGDSHVRKSVDAGILRLPAARSGFVRKDRLLLPAPAAESFKRRFSHRIVVSNGVLEGGGDDDDEDHGGGGGSGSGGVKQRWSDLRPSDLLFLRSEMIISDGAGRASAASGGCRGVIKGRCLSEISAVSRYVGGSGDVARLRAEEERAVLKRWLGFAAERTAQWLGSREIR